MKVEIYWGLKDSESTGLIDAPEQKIFMTSSEGKRNNHIDCVSLRPIDSFMRIQLNHAPQMIVLNKYGELWIGEPTNHYPPETIVWPNVAQEVGEAIDGLTKVS